MMRSIILCCTIITVFSYATGAENLIKNGGFEDKQLVPWESKQQAGWEKRLFTISAEQARSGKSSIMLQGDRNNKHKAFITLIQTLEQPVMHGKSYQLQGAAFAQVANPSGKSFIIAVREADAKDSSIKYQNMEVNLRGKDWQDCAKLFTPDDRTAKLQIYLIASNLDDQDKIYIDNISLMQFDGSGKSFSPDHKSKSDNGIILRGPDLALVIDRKSGLLSELSTSGQVIHPDADKVTCIYLIKNGQQILFKRSASAEMQEKTNHIQSELLPESPDIPLKADVKYELDNGLISEKVSFVATKDIDGPITLGVRHGFDSSKWQTLFCALRPLRIINSNQSTIFSYGNLSNDLNLEQLDQYQRTVYPIVILENEDFFLLTGSRNLDRFVTLSPNYPEGYLPSVQQNPIRVKKGQRFEFELTWKLFSKNKNMLRDVWRWYSANLYSLNPVIKDFVPYKPHSFRPFFPGCFAASTYFESGREKRLFPGSNVWWFGWHDWINEKYPTKDSWWTGGNAWKFKMTAERVKDETSRLQKNGHNLIFYFREIANLRNMGKEYPESWFRRSAGGALDMYGGGYEVKLPANVAKDVNYDSIPWGSYDFDNSEFRKHYIKEIQDAVNFYNPKAIGWDMSWHPNHMGMFNVQAEIFNWLRQKHPDKKVVSNESSGPTQFYSDMVLLENGMLGGKSKYDFEIAKGQNTTMVCLERWNLFRLAVEANITGGKTWLSAKGIAANKKYLDYLLKQRPELKTNINEAARLCQLRVSLYDLALGASPGYMEEIKPVPPALVKMAGEANGLPMVTESFMVKLPSGTDTDKDMAASVWIDANSCRVVVYNDKAASSAVVLRLSLRGLTNADWTPAQVSGGAATIVNPEGESQSSGLNIQNDNDNVIFSITLPPFSGLIYCKNKPVN